jgi:hypothetical protein
MRMNIKDFLIIFGIVSLIFSVQPRLCNAQVTITPESVLASPGDVGVDVGVCLDNPEDLVGSIQLDLCEYTMGGDPIDFMECIDCKLTERTPTYNCEILELPDGCCRVLLYPPNPDYSIDTGLCDVVTVVYSISEPSQEYIGTPCIVTMPENLTVGDHEGFLLIATGWSGELCLPDDDSDSMPDEWDNCPVTPNPNQEDTYPPQGNGIGDACDCESDFTCDGDVDSEDVTELLKNYGRSWLHLPCTNDDQCSGDFTCDADVDAEDIAKSLEDFGRSIFFKPCPVCTVGSWCVYP